MFGLDAAWWQGKRSKLRSTKPCAPQGFSGTPSQCRLSFVANQVTLYQRREHGSSVNESIRNRPPVLPRHRDYWFGWMSMRVSNTASTSPFGVL